MKQTKLNIISALLFVAAMAFGNSAWAQTFTIEASHNNSTHKTTFTIERSGSSLPQQTIKYRTVNLSAYAGIHYTAVSDTYTFPENITTFQVEVSESAQYTTAYAYHYQTGTTRSYRFEVLDVNGFELAHNDRSMTTGAQFSNTYLNNGVTDLVYFNDNGQIQSGSGNKYLDVSYSSSNWTQVTDAGYSQGVHTVSTNSLYNSNSNLRTILNALSYKMYATVYFTQKEEHDGYQYIQIYTGNAGTYDKVDDPNGGIGTLTNSLYRACFILSYSPSGSVMSDPHYQFFPHRYNYVDKAAEIAANITHYEFDYNNSHLYEQKFINNSYNSSTSGSLVLLPTAENINIRFDAGGGGNDHDEWDFKDLKVRLALVDETYPTPINIAGITVSAGPYVKGNTFYISVPFSEIVNTAYYSNNKKLVTSWGDATYCSGDGTNVITFKGTINANAGTTLAITSLQCNFKDLTGTLYQGLGSSNYTDSFDKTFTGVTCTESYTLEAANTEFTGLADEYVLSNNGPIQPHPTVYFYKGKKETANKVQLTENTNYTLSWANNNAAGNGRVTATGTGIYTGSASATFPIRWSTYTFSFHGNGSIGIPAIGTMSNQVFQYGVAQNLTTNAFSREGFTFAGWNTQPDGNGTAYTNGQSIIGLTTDDGAVIDLYAQWALIPWTGSGDSEDDPYMILYASQLDLLATNVNSGNNYSGKFFKLDADITYAHTTLWNDANSTENNYTAIGTSTNNFRGTFDGDNHTISGIRIYNTDDNQGLFGYANYATIKNVILSDARIEGNTYIGGIAGYIHYATTIQSCLVSNAAIIGNDKVGAVVGFKFSGSDYLIYNYYLGCIVKKGSTTYYTGIGLGQPQGDYVNEVASLHTLSLSDNITASGESVVIDNVTYYAHLSTITLGYTGAVDAGYNVNYQYNDGTAHAVVGNTFKMPGADVTVSSTFTDVWGIAGGADGTEAHPYIISDTTGLNVLAKCVNGTDGYTTNNFYNKHFKLGNDITYSTEGLGENESNYTAIGNYDNKFKGSFDGVNHTISGIRIYTTNDYQGLFGYVYSGSTVKNIALANSIIIGGDYVGSIAGKNEYGTITNCRIGNDVTIGVENDDKDYHGGIVGYQYDGTVSGSVIAASVNGLWYCGGIAGICVFTTLKDCLYTGTIANDSWKGAITGKNNNSTLTNNYYTTDGIGGVNGSDCNGARRARVITLGDNVGIAGDQTVYDVSGITAMGATVLSYDDGNSTTVYSGATQDVTLSDAAPQGYAVTSYSLNGTPLEGNAFTMPDSDVTVSATIGVPYIDADGNEQVCTDYTLVESSTGNTVTLGTSGTETWYAVTGNVNITYAEDEAINANGSVHLILMDGATLTVEGNRPIDADGSLSIYGQSLGTGCLTASGSGSAIYVYDGTLTINGGIVTATSSTGSGIYAYDITINGGSVSADGGGINANGALTLGWRNASDRIYASSYYGYSGVAVKSGQYLSDGTAVYSGTLSTTQVNALASKTLQPAFALTLPKYVNATSGALVQEGHTAYAQAGANVTIAGEGCTLANVTVGGEAATDNGDGTWSFIMPATDATVSATVPLPEVTVTNNVQTICMDNQIQEMEIIYSNGTIESVTGLPENVNWSDTPSGATIFGAPAEYGTFNATVTVTSDQGCGTATADVTITVKPNPEVTVSNNFQTVCENSAITAMEITATHATIENVTGLPTGVSWSKDSSGATGTISGTPTASGTYNVTVTVNSDQTPSCGIAYAYVRITVNPLPDYTLDITGYGDSDGGWNLIASPLAESIAATEVGNLVAETASDFDLYRFNQAANMEWENWKQEESEHYHFNLESGQGYLYASKEDVTLTFLGTPNSDDAVNVSLSYTEGKPLAGFNLVGNPFTVDAYVNRPFYKMNDAGTGIEAIENYNDYTTAQTIPACTGIVVKADNSGESVIFSTTAPSLSAPNNGNLQITLTQANTRGNALLDNAIVSFNEGSQLGKFYFGEQNGNIYIPQGGKEFAIAYSEGMGEMPLNFKARKNGEYTITVNPDNVEMSFLHLIDNLTGADVDLLQTPSYTFSARNDDYASRFKLVFKALGNSSETEEDFAFISNGEIIINGKGIVQVIDLMGRIILADEANRNISTKGFVSGVYVLRLIDGENAKTQKIVIQ